MIETCSIDYLKENPVGVMQLANASKQPVFITQGEKATALIVDVDTYLFERQALEEFRRVFEAGKYGETIDKDAVARKVAEEGVG